MRSSAEGRNGPAQGCSRQPPGEGEAKGAEARCHREPEHRPTSRESAGSSAAGEERRVRRVGDGSCPEPGRRVLAAEEAGGED